MLIRSMTTLEPLAGGGPDVPEGSSRNLSRRFPGQPVEDGPQLVIVRRLRTEHHDRGVPVPQIGPEGGPLRSGDPGARAVVDDVDEQLGGRAERRAVVPGAALERPEEVPADHPVALSGRVVPVHRGERTSPEDRVHGEDRLVTVYVLAPLPAGEKPG